MGPYKRTNKTVHGYPAFTKVEGGVTHYLYRASDMGNWVVAPNEDFLAQNRGTIFSKVAAELPTKEGMKWLYSDDGWKEDSAIACTEVGQVLASIHYALSAHHPGQATLTLT